MTGTFLTSVRYMYTHSIDSLPVHYRSRLAINEKRSASSSDEIADFQAYSDLINSERSRLFGVVSSGGIFGNGTSLE
jgi:hypothetical protein